MVNAKFKIRTVTMQVMLIENVVHHPSPGTQETAVVGRMRHSLKIIKEQVAIVLHSHKHQVILASTSLRIR